MVKNTVDGQDELTSYLAAELTGSIIIASSHPRFSYGIESKHVYTNA
jgi:hypothetical protein